MSLREVREALEAWAGRGETAAVATLVDVRHSAPREPGARFAVSNGGELAGSVSSGCVEGDLHEHLVSLLGGAAADVLGYGITDEMAADVGLSCGGEIDVLVERHDPDDPVWPVLHARIDEGTPAVLVTGLAADIRSRRLLVTDGDRTGTLGAPELDAAAAAAAEGLLGRPGTLRRKLVEGDPGTDAFLESFAPPPLLVIVGATPIAEALCAFAVRCGFDVAIVDPRAAFARAERFPDAREVVVEWPEAAYGTLGLDRFASVVVLTHDAKLDEPALAGALRAGCAYVGLLGGRRTQALRREALLEAGFAPGEVERIRGPVGLDIGAKGPPQIAVSILAQMIEEGRAP